jgi:hypothetical protein
MSETMFKEMWRSLALENPEGNGSSSHRTTFGKIFSQVVRRKALRDIIFQTNEGELTRLLGFFTLNTLGLGAIIGKITRKENVFFELNFSLTIPLPFIRCWYLQCGGPCCCKFCWSS